MNLKEEIVINASELFTQMQEKTKWKQEFNAFIALISDIKEKNISHHIIINRHGEIIQMSENFQFSFRAYEIILTESLEVYFGLDNFSLSLEKRYDGLRQHTSKRLQDIALIKTLEKVLSLKFKEITEQDDRDDCHRHFAYSKYNDKLILIYLHVTYDDDNNND